VLVIDATLGALSQFLRRLEIAQRGHVFIVDDAGRLVAASHGAVTDDKGACYPLGSAPESAARAVGAIVAGHGGPGRAPTTLAAGRSHDGSCEARGQGGL
jgi:hypothetical protein